MQIDPRMVKWDDEPKDAKGPKIDARMVKWDEPEKEKGGFLQGVGNLAAGAVRGAGSIGATLLTPVDAAARAMGVQNDFIGRTDRRQAMDGGLQEMGAEPDSFGYKGGKLLLEVAGTAGIGGGAANVIGRVAPRAAAAMPGFVQALRSGGLSANGANLGVRTAGGSVNGALTAGAINPMDAGQGAIIGGALPGGVKAAGWAGNKVREGVGAATKGFLGMTSGVGSEAVGTAYSAGKTGGTKFLDNMRGNVPFTDVLDDAKNALGKMRIERGNQYRSGMAGVSADKTVIDFTPIDAAAATLKKMGSFKGKVINKNASSTVDEITSVIDDWKALDPAEFHTPEGLDALKQAIGDIRDATQFGTPGRRAADTAYNAVKGEINKQAPGYAKVMKDYSEASDLVKEIERSLVGGEKTSADTAMRKLQSLMRNNVNTNYGNRLELAKTLEKSGAEILPAVAGQQMSSMTPRGLQAAAASIGGLGALATNPVALSALPLTSPRLIGEAAYGLGALNRGASQSLRASAQKATGLLGSSPSLTLDQLLPLLAATPIVSAGQR